jgi:hypothetical protein
MGGGDEGGEGKPNRAARTFFMLLTPLWSVNFKSLFFETGAPFRDTKIL